MFRQGTLRREREEQCFDRPVGIEQPGVGRAANVANEPLQFDLIRIALRYRHGRADVLPTVTAKLVLGGPPTKVARCSTAARSNDARKPTRNGEPGGIGPLAVTVASRPSR